ncbi:uncharacterized protein LOC127790474 [Diospyros lotus]|uniref:uncharacterized protein LOC127790474 n=1 Tax=Diospyros lotus TaxID=55363 RepID=UPI00225119FC|nr:uncharacterized protein LOC127790474 [Diospyros lotus]
MAFIMSPVYWRSMASRQLGAIRRSGFVPALDLGHHPPQATKPRSMKGERVPAYVAVGMIAVSTSLGLFTAMHQLKRAPDVAVRKSRRETVPEVEDPDRVVEDAGKFINKSLFRKVARIHPRGHAPAESLVRQPHVETLKSVRVDPRMH